MNCHAFERALPDWIAERLPPEQANRMQAHHDACPVCQRAALAERALRQRWKDLPAPPEVPSVWPRLSARLEVAPHQPRFRPFPAWAMGGAVAAAGLAGALLWMQTSRHQPNSPLPEPVPITANVDEQRVVRMVSEIHELPDSESDEFFSETQYHRQTQRRLLLGKEGR